jgi:hypothetical protein
VAPTSLLVGYAPILNYLAIKFTIVTYSMVCDLINNIGCDGIPTLRMK